ncbi:hypothetical protein [Ruminiclostridium papyrosolvens]|uniref:Glycerophosphoryl diester phosphodiesterase membrane domain-containing protein n=1 Tax=Ruminiclostridium papyrosolvens C7 TaxID=1330534 RepID=U4R505_9FIRM|nr:hypothetical protein [Ruminiclostridium papyrosolvens]EPR13676.1 hypothetical protein L323_02800 [Ruminiclostridium papyrosolvens C7]
MGIVNKAVHLIAKRPAVLLLTALLSTVVCVFEYFFMTLFYGLTMFKTGSPFDDYVNIIQFVINTISVPETAVKIILALVIAVLAASLILGLIFSGCFNILYNAVEGKEKKAGSEFVQGIKKYFLRMISLNLWTICAFVIFIIYALIAIIPAAIVVDNSISGSMNPLAGIVLSIITAAVLFFSYTFFRQYIVFWYPSAIVHDKNHFKLAKKISDSNFWSLLSKFVAFDITLVLFDILYIIANFTLANTQVVSGTINTILIVVNIVFKTIVFAILICFVFSSFKKCSDDYKQKKAIR